MKFIAILFLCLLSNCTSTKSDTNSDLPIVKIEEVIKYSQPSFDQNERNSGIIDFVDGKGWLITEGALKRYNELINKYGTDFSPVLSRDFGLTIEYEKSAKLFLSQEAMVKFAIMNQKNTQ